MLVVTVPDVPRALTRLHWLSGVSYVEPIRRSRRLAFVPDDPLAVSQWYLAFVRAFDFWAERPPTAPVLVATIDSGIDGGHPEFAGRIEAARSFVAGKATRDPLGHGTMVAGEIAAAIDNGRGIAGMAFPARLLVAKVARRDGTVSTEAIARAIRWATDRGAEVINLSFGGLRDPANPARDTYSRLEHAAIEYAVSRGVLVVAPTGNCQAICPFGFAHYPAALPHVLGVSAVAQDGRALSFSNRDSRYNDLAAPGTGIISTLPTTLTDASCGDPGYSLCASDPFQRLGQGTSFAAPLVSAAAALLLSEQPNLRPDQLRQLLVRSARDLGPAGRDRETGAGALDVTAALVSLSGPRFAADHLEPNDDLGRDAPKLWGKRRSLRATFDRYDDPLDVYRVFLRKGQRLSARLQLPAGTKGRLILWPPRTGPLSLWRPARERRIEMVRPAQKTRSRRAPSLNYRARRQGWHSLALRLTKGPRAGYMLKLVKRRAAK